MSDPLLVPLPGNEGMGAKIAAALALEVGKLDMRRFPDGETYLRFESDIGDRGVILVCTLDQPDAKIAPLIFAAATARDLGARRVGLVCPYLAYMRQDRRFRPGEGITSAYFAKLLSAHLDWLVTVDPHLHRHAALSEIYAIPAVSLHAMPLVAAWIRENVREPLIIGPDRESEQWVAAAAREAQAPYAVLEKTRRGDRDVEIAPPELAKWRGRTPVLVDDIISTAHTMIETVKQLRKEGMKPPTCVAVHGLFAARAYEELIAIGVELVVTTNTIAHSTSAIDVSGLIARGLRPLALGGAAS